MTINFYIIIINFFGLSEYFLLRYINKQYLVVSWWKRGNSNFDQVGGGGVLAYSVYGKNYFTFSADAKAYKK